MCSIASSSDSNYLQRSLAVLVVEDEVPVRLIIADYLREVGYTVVEVANAQEALTVIASRVPIDLVFTDINMPGTMDGESLANWLLTHRPKIPVLLTSGGVRLSIDSSQTNRRFLAKPYSALDVEDQIGQLLRRASS